MLSILIAMLLQGAPLQSTAPAGLREGLISLNRGEIAAAKTSLESAAKLDEQNAIVWAGLAQVYLKLGKSDEAHAAAAKAEKFGRDTPAIQHALSLFYAGAGDTVQAAGFERMFALAVRNQSEPFLRAAKLYLDSGHEALAIETTKEGITQADSAGLHVLLANIYGSRRQELALQELTRALTLEPQNEEAAFELGQALLRWEHFAQAATSLEESAKRFPESAQIRLTLGVAYYGLRRFLEAVDAFLKTIEMAPDVEQPYVFLGRMLDQAGDRLPAIQTAFEQYRVRHPESSSASFLLAKALALGGGTQEQIEPLLREAIARDADAWEAHAELAELLSRRHEYAGAAAEFERGAKLNPAEASIPFRLARVYDRLGQREKAAAQRELHQRLLGNPKAGMGAGKP